MLLFQEAEKAWALGKTVMLPPVVLFDQMP